MFKVSEEARVQYNSSIEPYKEKINAIMEKEKAVKNTMHEIESTPKNPHCQRILGCVHTIIPSSMRHIAISGSRKTVFLR